MEYETISADEAIDFARYKICKHYENISMANVLLIEVAVLHAILCNCSNDSEKKELVEYFKKNLDEILKIHLK
jgi:hypothetical protein